MQTKEKRQCKRLSVVHKVIIAAVMVVILATSVWAAPQIFGLLKSGSTQNAGGIWVPATGASGEPSNIHVVKLDITMNEDAPKSIENYYIPVLDTGYVQYFGFVYKDAMTAIYHWTYGEENWEEEIRFWQTAGGSFDPEEPVCTVHTKVGETPEAKMTELGGIGGYLVEDAFSYGSRYFFWSDGEYLFHLEVPDEYSDEEIAKILESISVISDITPYCVSMTQSDMEKVFG